MAGAGATAEVQRTFLLENRDWLTLTPSQEGPAEVSLSAAGDLVSRVTFTGVAEAELQGVRLRHSERLLQGRARDGDWLVVLAEGVDRAGRTLYGVEFQWTFGGSPEAGLGDLYRYEYREGMRRMLVATHGALSAAEMIEAKRGFVESTNRLGCALGRGSPAAAAPLLILLAALLLRRRRG